ncbi:MAG: SH3 domain-containing protein [Oceanospirillaceae bacterium]|nr:SH3 domain-containing protein [Oceanospirillaceae bacterium]
MINRITAFFCCSLLLLASNTFAANSFFSNLPEGEVKKIFDRADSSADPVYLTNNSELAIPAVQILPSTDSPKTAIKPTTQCIKLYSCNQSICLIGVNNKKYATSEVTLNKLTQLQEDSSSCKQPPATENLAVKETSVMKPSNSKASSDNWFKVIQVKSDDSLNVRQKANYKSLKTGTLAYNASCIKRIVCNGKWCKIEHQSLIGWVHNSFLAPLDSDQLAQCL